MTTMDLKITPVVSKRNQLHLKSLLNSIQERPSVNLKKIRSLKTPNRSNCCKIWLKSWPDMNKLWLEAYLLNNFNRSWTRIFIRKICSCLVNVLRISRPRTSTKKKLLKLEKNKLEWWVSWCFWTPVRKLEEKVLKNNKLQLCITSRSLLISQLSSRQMLQLSCLMPNHPSESPSHLTETMMTLMRTSEVKLMSQ